MGGLRGSGGIHVDDLKGLDQITITASNPLTESAHDSAISSANTFLI